MSLLAVLIACCTSSLLSNSLPGCTFPLAFTLDTYFPGDTQQTLNDELLSLNLELTNVTQRNSALQADNAALLQRWLDKMNLTAEEMNVEFEKEATIRSEEAELVIVNEIKPGEDSGGRNTGKDGGVKAGGKGKEKGDFWIGGKGR